MTETPTMKSYAKDQVVSIINSVMAKVGDKDSMCMETLATELTGLKQIIDEARKDIGASRAGDIGAKFIPTATDELDAIVEATAEATGTIMDACEKIQEHTPKAGEAGVAIDNEVINIFEACTFQDITGQRITKVVSTLKNIDEKVNHLLSIMGEDMSHDHAQGDHDDGRSEDEKLLNGPQLKGQGISQDEIDKLLEDF